MKTPSDTVMIVGLVGLGALAVWGLFGVGKGIISGSNSLTQNQTDASGNVVTAYDGAGIVGTVGAAANTASGGVLASVGETLGSWAFDIFGPKTPDWISK